MLAKIVLPLCAIWTVIGACQIEFARAGDEHEWFGDHISIRELCIIVRDEGIEKELSITPEQQQAVNESERQFRPRFSELFRLARDSTTGASVEDAKQKVVALEREFRPQMWNILTAAQRDRLLQIIWQLNVALSLSSESKVTSRIQLDEKQKGALAEIMDQYKKDLRKGLQEFRPASEERLDHDEAAEVKRDELAMKILTDDQRSEWSKLIGQPVDVLVIRPRLNPLRARRERAKARLR